MMNGVEPKNPIMRGMSRRITIVDVAKACGVTPATVSRVLNAKKDFSSSDAVRKKIVEAALQMGYVPNLAARNLVRQETHIIGVFASPHTHIAEGINESLLEGFASVLHPAGYDVFFEMSSLERRGHAVPFWRFDGALLMQQPKPETVAELDRRGVPYVCVNERVGNPLAYVLADDAMGMNRAVEYLSQLGHKRIAYTNTISGYFSHYSVTDRYETLLAGVKKHHMELVLGYDRPFTQATDFLNVTVKANGATAIITYDHRIAVRLVGAAANMGMRIPRDFSLICFNDVYPVDLLSPPITAIAVSGREMGRVGADLLLKQLQSKRPQKVSEIRIPEDLVVRGSTAPPPELQ
jgi:LacI family transcriptional regulator